MQVEAAVLARHDPGIVPVGLEHPALLVVEQVRHHHLVQHLVVHRLVEDRQHELDTAIEVALHPVGRGNEQPGAVIG
ncbi:hypothetical protein QU38_01750, partial [Staphylococcus aureus]